MTHISHVRSSDTTGTAQHDASRNSDVSGVPVRKSLSRSRPAQYATVVGARQRIRRTIDENERDLGLRILRVVRRFEWVSSMEITDVLGIPSAATDRQLHNTYSVALSRLGRNGFLYRRFIMEWIEYKISPLGLARIESCERAVIEDKRSIAA